MQTKTIQKVIEAKMNNWLNSITEESLKKELKDNILVSGGSITSMYLGEPVNDYDVYIKDINVLKRVAEYYCKPFDNIKLLDGRLKNNYVADYNKEHLGVADLTDAIGHKASSLRNLKDNQIKLYLDEKAVFLVDYLPEKEIPFRPLCFSANAISLSDDVQLVLRFHGDNEQIHSTYDFIHATNYFTFKDGLVTNKAALESILTKQLKYQGSLYPLTTIIRIRKFVKRGWNIGAGELLKVMFQISQLDLTNMDVLEEQLIGVDVAYFAQLIDALRSVKPEKLTSLYINAIIDKVFNESAEID